MYGKFLFKNTYLFIRYYAHLKMLKYALISFPKLALRYPE